MVFPLVTEFLFSVVPVSSSSGSVLSGYVSTVAATVPINVEATQNFATSINITGNIIVGGNNVTTFSGLSPSLRARVFLDGTIVVRDNGTLVLRYVTLYLMGGRRDYDRFIRLSNPSVGGRPRLVVLNATIIAYAWNPSVVVKVSYGSVIDVRNNGEVTGKELAFYREKFTSSKSGSPALLNCSGDSSVDLSYAYFDAIRSQNNARVSVSMGAGPKNPTTRQRESVVLDMRGFSRGNFFGVNFTDSTVSGSANVSLAWSKQVSGTSLFVRDRAKVDILMGSVLAGSILRPSINASGNSIITVNSSEVRTSIKTNYLVLVRDNVTFSAYNATMLGRIIARERSSLYFRNMSKPNSLKEMLIELRDFAKGYFYNCLLYFGASGSVVLAYDNAYLSFVSSTISYGLIQFFNSSSGYFSGTSAKTSHLFADDNSNVTFAEMSSVENALEVRKNSSVRFDSSSAMVLFGVETAKVSLVNSSVSMVQVKENAKLSIVNSSVKELLFTANDVSGSWTGLTNFFVDSNLTLAEGSPNLVVFNSYVEAMDVLFLGRSNVTISNSTLRNIDVQGSSVVKLYNVSFALETADAVGNGKIYVWSVFRVRTVDYFGNPLSGVNTSIFVGRTPYGRRLASRLSDENGWIRLLLFSELINSTGRFPVGDIHLYSLFSRTSARQDAILSAVNEDKTLNLPLPFWTGFIIPALLFLALIAILGVASFVWGRFRRKQT